MPGFKGGKLVKCSDCGKLFKHPVYDWLQKLPWCRECFKKLLED
jgi:hypothetical protein